MIDFKKVELKDKKWMDPLINAADMRGSHQNFTNIFAWSGVFNFRVARINDYLVVKGGKDDSYRYFYPIGFGEVKPVIDRLMEDAVDREQDFVLAGLSPENINVLKSLYPEKFEYKAMRDSFDYIYNLDKLVNLKGNKLHSKRNHINRFKANNSWSFEEITLDNIDECWEMNSIWCKIHDCKEDEMLSNEVCAVTNCFDNYIELGLEGGLLRSDGRVIAYTMGERLNSDTYVIHVEKAFGEIQGSYQMINREFAEHIQKKYPQIVYVNREEDMGYEGLRKAKLSYYPDEMEEKYIGMYIK